MADLSDNAMSQLGALVRAYRRKAGLTQRELATKAGLSVAAIRDFEQSRRRRPRTDSLAALAGALDLNADQVADLRHAVTAAGAGSGGPTGGGGLWLGVLGPLEAWGGGVRLALGPPGRRAVLGMLLADPGTLVRRDAIMDVLWGEDPPRTAAGLVQAHVSRIRRLLGAYTRPRGGDGPIGSVRGGYWLAVPREEVDLLVFRELAGGAAEAEAAGDGAGALERYERAVGLWRGDPLADVDELSGYPGVAVLRQELTGVLLRYADVACGLGQHRRVLPRLRELARAEPLNEPAHARLMIALAGAGQQADALRAYEDVRSRLDRELGIYPGRELSEAYLRVLRQETGGGHQRPGGPVVPRQLPCGPRFFVGRARELAALSALAGRDAGRASGAAIAALTGMAGSGKTALAVQWAHQAACRFPDGQLFADLCCAGPAGAIRGFLAALGVPPDRVPHGTEGQAALYRSLLAGRRMLVVLDNARSAEQVRPLLPGSPGCLVLVTSRSRLTGLAAAPGADLLTLGLLARDEALGLLAEGLEPGAAAADPAAVSELVALCDGLPLALSNAAARAAARPGLPLSALAAEARDPRTRLDALETGEPATSIRTVLARSLDTLPGPAARMFRLLSIHPGPDITAAAAASLAGLPPASAAAALARLLDEHLLAEHDPGRYALHGLLRCYAAEQARARDTGTARRAAARRMLDHYLHTATAAAALLHARRPPAPPPGITPEPVDSPACAAAWFTREQPALLSLITQAAEDAHAPHAWQLPATAGPYLTGDTAHKQLAVAQETALQLAVILGDHAGTDTARQHLDWRSRPLALEPPVRRDNREEGLFRLLKRNPGVRLPGLRVGWEDLPQ